mgnify:FL=1
MKHLILTTLFSIISTVMIAQVSLYDFKVKDIAQIVNIPPSTVGYKIKKIEKILKNRLGDIGYER